MLIEGRIKFQYNSVSYLITQDSMAQSSGASEVQSFLNGMAALVVWGDVDSTKVDEASLNDWWTNEHLPERLSIRGFLRARRYYEPNELSNRTKYLTLYEVSSVDTLTSEAYMEKLNNPTPSTEKHLPTLAAMQRPACRVAHSEVRHDLRTCGTGVGGTMAMFVLSLPPDDTTASTLRRLLSKAFRTTQRTNKSAMTLNILQEDRAATEPGSSSQSYLNVNIKPTTNASMVKWVMLFEFPSTARQAVDGVQKMLNPVMNELSLTYGILESLLLGFMNSCVV